MSKPVMINLNASYITCRSVSGACVSLWISVLTPFRNSQDPRDVTTEKDSKVEKCNNAKSARAFISFVDFSLESQEFSAWSLLFHFCRVNL